MKKEECAKYGHDYEPLIIMVGWPPDLVRVCKLCGHPQKGIIKDLVWEDVNKDVAKEPSESID